MHYLMQKGDLVIRLMNDDREDYEAMAGWLTDPRVLEFYEGRDNPYSVERVMREYSPSALIAEGVTACILILREMPVGYVQYYSINAEGDMGIDQFIGQPDLWNQGIGTQAISLFLTYLFEIQHARRVTLDPHVSNVRAIRCYEKCGFRKLKILARHELHEGEYRDSWLMEISAGHSSQQCPTHESHPFA